ncbi:CfaE/CblD family pilus tip adhesin, partial [Burkholderia diffusa]|uniref:CfaE/CblD family pilus tip adhesin n=1 Tax=Burkholderia diffusa TaxID=488732 RepID=UPI002ABDB33C
MLLINRIRCRAIVLTAILSAITLDVSAAKQAPADRNDTAQAVRDRGSPVSDVVIFNNASGGYDTSDAPNWGRNSWTCRSSTDPATGACPTEPEWVAAAGNTTIIKLSFKEEKTGATAVLNLQGQNAHAIHRDCDGNAIPEFIFEERHAMNDARSRRLQPCVDVIYDGRVLFVKIPAAELKNLPSGGTWKANLQLDLRMWGTGGTGAKLALFKSAITLNVTDKDNIQVYLPEFTSATPTVDLKLRTLPNGSRMSGTS